MLSRIRKHRMVHMLVVRAGEHHKRTLAVPCPEPTLDVLRRVCPLFRRNNIRRNDLDRHAASMKKALLTLPDLAVSDNKRRTSVADEVYRYCVPNWPHETDISL